MRKLTSLREAITAALPEIAQNPDNLRIWIERGSGRCQGTRTEAFAFTFQANILIVEMASDIAVLALTVFRWARANQPELLAPGRDGFSFDADILDNACADILIQIDLTQNASVDGGEVTYLDEPDPLFDDGLGLAGTAPIPRLAAVDIAEVFPPWET